MHRDDALLELHPRTIVHHAWSVAHLPTWAESAAPLDARDGRSEISRGGRFAEGANAMARGRLTFRMWIAGVDADYRSALLFLALD